jgi:hypothetical protein
MALGTVADDGDGLAGEVFEVGIGVVVDGQRQGRNLRVRERRSSWRKVHK